MHKISVVTPLFNEEENIRALYERLKKVLTELKDFTHEIIFVDDGSVDRSLEIMKELAAADSSFRYLSFSRNFGHEAASSAGLDHAEGDCVVLIDGDLQDPPELIPEMVEKWREGYKVVYAVRRTRRGESFLKRFTSLIFYRFINLISEQKLPLDTGDYRLISREVLLAFRTMGDYHRMIRGMITWLGFRQIGIPYDRPERHAGKTKYGLIRLMLLTLDAITSFSIAPLRFVMALGFIITLLSIIKGLHIIYQKLIMSLAIPGYALQTVGLFFLSGIQLVMLGVIGEYVGKIYQQTQRRPLYVLAEKKGFEEKQ